MFQLLQNLWREGWTVFTVHHKGPTWPGCSLVTNLAHTAAFQVSHSSVLAKQVQYFQHFSVAPASPALGVCPWWHQPVHPSNCPETGRRPAQGSGLWSLACLSPLSLYIKRCWWIMSPVTLCLWSRAATGASVWKSGWGVGGGVPGQPV